MKRIFLILALIVVLFTGCVENRYNEANEYFNNEDYKSALEIYVQISDYADSKDKIAICEREIGMRENSDYDFLEQLEECISKRLENENIDIEEIIEYELFILKEFKDKEFYDKRIANAAERYIDALEQQEESLNNDLIWKFQVEYQQNLLNRMYALETLHNLCGFMNDNEKFIKTYIYDLEEEKNYLYALNAIIDDINSQQGNVYNYWSGSTWCLIFENNTDYSYDIYFEIEHMNANNVVMEKEYAVAENVKPKEKYSINIPFSSAFYNDYPSFYCRNFYIENIVL